MAAYMVAHYKDQPAVKLKIDEAGEAIHDIATGDGVPDVPAGSTIKEQVSKAVDLLEKSAFKLKKKV
jgi:16S rRNA G527 N7-methylase RsmG